jgi:hypothetical protein
MVSISSYILGGIDTDTFSSIFSGLSVVGFIPHFASSFTSVLGPVQMALQQLVGFLGTCLEYAQELDVEDAMEMLGDSEELVDEMEDTVVQDGGAAAAAEEADAAVGLGAAVGLTAAAVAAGIAADEMGSKRDKNGKKDDGGSRGACSSYVCTRRKCFLERFSDTCLCVCVRERETKCRN